MRATAFQCCHDWWTGIVKGLTMFLRDPLSEIQDEGKEYNPKEKASTGCMGVCYTEAVFCTDLTEIYEYQESFQALIGMTFSSLDGDVYSIKTTI